MIDWGYVSGRLRSNEQYLLDFNTLTRWSEADGKQGLLKYVNDSVYADLFDENTILDYVSVFEKHLLDEYAEIKELIPEDTLIKLHTLTYDLNNIKIIYKAKVMGADVNWKILSEKGTISPEELFTIMEEGRYFKLPQGVGEVFPEIDKEFKKSENIQHVDFLIDRAFNDYRFSLLSGDAVYRPVFELYSVWADMENIKNMLRAKKMKFERSVLEFIILRNGNIGLDFYETMYHDSYSDILDELSDSQYGEIVAGGLSEIVEFGHFSRFEKEIDEYVLKRMKPFRYVSQGPEVVEEYIALKNMEIKNLKIIFIGKLNDMSVEQIKRRIRNNDI